MTTATVWLAKCTDKIKNWKRRDETLNVGLFFVYCIQFFSLFPFVAFVFFGFFFLSPFPSLIFVRAKPSSKHFSETNSHVFSSGYYFTQFFLDHIREWLFWIKLFFFLSSSYFRTHFFSIQLRSNNSKILAVYCTYSIGISKVKWAKNHLGKYAFLALKI